MSLERISDSPNPSAPRPAHQKKEVEAGKFRRYIQKVKAVQRDERKKTKRKPAESKEEPLRKKPARSKRQRARQQLQSHEKQKLLERFEISEQKALELDEIGLPAELALQEPAQIAAQEQGASKGYRVEAGQLTALGELLKKRSAPPKKSLFLQKEELQAVNQTANKSAQKRQANATKEPSAQLEEQIEAVQSTKEPEEKKALSAGQLEPLPSCELSQVKPSLTTVDHSTPLSQLFFHMVSQIHIVAKKRETHTTITLSNQAFQGSIFYGSQIVIQESATAPAVYNIGLYGATHEARQLFENHAAKLLQMLQSKPYPFLVHRIDTGYRDKLAIQRKAGAQEQEMAT